MTLVLNLRNSPRNAEEVPIIVEKGKKSLAVERNGKVAQLIWQILSLLLMAIVVPEEMVASWQQFREASQDEDRSEVLQILVSARPQSASLQRPSQL
jgi:hypothetical protein